MPPPPNAVDRVDIATLAFTWLGLLLAVLALGIQVLPAADTWWHLAAGELILNSGSLPTRDVFSFTAGSHAWLNHEWLAEILFALIARQGGLKALCLMKLLALAMSAALLPALSLYRENKSSFWLWTIPFTLYACQWSYFVDVRAYLVTYLGISLTVFSLIEHRRSGRKGWLLLCPALAVVWVNCHGGFILGPAIMGVYFLVGPNRRELGLATAGTIFAAGLNPEGPAILLFPFSLLKKDAFSVGLNEWAKPDLLGAQLPYLLLTIGLAVVVVINRKRVSLPLFLSTLAFVLLGLLAWRHEPLAGLMLCYLVPRILPQPAMPRPHALAVSAVILLGGAGYLAQRRNLTPAQMMGLNFFPGGAVSYLKEHPDLPSNLSNPYGWGGFLLWQLYPNYKVFFDGRAHTVYPEEVFRDGYYLQYGEPWKKLLAKRGIEIPASDRLENLDTYRIDLVLTNKLQGDLSQALAEDIRWAKIFEDHTSILYRRKHPNSTESGQ